jgi:hypothetical protein
MMKMMMRRGRNKRRKTKARIVTSNSTLNSLMKIYGTIVVCKGIKFHWNLEVNLKSMVSQET